MAKYDLNNKQTIPQETADEVATNTIIPLDQLGKDKYQQKVFDSTENTEMKINIENQKNNKTNEISNYENKYFNNKTEQIVCSESFKSKQSYVEDDLIKCPGCMELHQVNSESVSYISDTILNNDGTSSKCCGSHSCQRSGVGAIPVYKSVANCMGSCMDSDSMYGISKNNGRLPEDKESLMSTVTTCLKKGCTMKMLRKRVPILEWLPRYSLSIAFSDLIAGVTVGLTVIPQAIAYANVAGLPPQYGLYSSFMACFVYTIFGSCKDSPIGPTAIAAILTRENLHDLGPEFAVLLCFLSGCVEFLMGVLQLGFLIDFISGPVSVGFTSAAAIIIATTQVKDILGLSFPGGKFLQVWQGLFQHIGQSRLWDTVLGLSCIVILLFLRKVKDIFPVELNEKEDTGKTQKIFSKILWFLSTSRNILVVVLCAFLAYFFEMHNQSPFVLTGHVKPGLPNVTLPPFESTVNNKTYTFIEMASSMSSAIFVVPLLSILENIALAKVFSEGKPVDATQEMLAIGLCNIASSFVSSMPVSGALSRGAVNHASGVKTTFGGVYTGLLVIVSLQFFTPYFHYIPKASLAAVIIAAVIFMVELHVFKPIWRTKKIDLIPAVVTFISCLVIRLELGIFIGISINLLFLLYASARPRVHVNKTVSIPSGVEYLVITPDRSLVFPSVEYVRAVVSKAGIRQALSKMPVVLDATHIQGADFTAAQGIKSLIDDFHARGQPLIFYNLKPSIVSIFQAVQPREFKFCRCPAALDSLLQYNNTTNSLTRF